MKGLKPRASRFFEHTASPDEQVAMAQVDYDFDFGAGIETHRMSKKAPRLSQRMSEDIDKPLPVTPSSVSLSDMGNEEGTTGDYIFTPHSSEERLLGVARLSGNSAEIETGATSPIPDGPTFKKRSGLFGLRSKKSSFFRDNNATEPSPPPPPPRPQISVDPFTPDPSPPTKSSQQAAGKRFSSFGKRQNRKISISRPILLTQASTPPVPERPTTFKFTKPTGPPPVCPPRPESLDEVTLEFMRSCGTRIMQAKNNHSSNDTTFSTAPPSSRVSVESRLCLPSGHKVASHFSTIDSSRASVYPIDALQPSHWRDSTGNIRIREQVASSAVDDSGRGEGPVEQYDSNMEGHWKLEKRCSQGPNGNPGMLFRDASGESRFVSDI